MAGSWPPSSEEDPFLFFPCADGDDDPSSYLLYPPGFGPVEDWLVDPMEGQGGELLGLSEDMSRKISLVKEESKDEMLGTAGEESSGVLEAPVTPSEGIKAEVKVESDDDDSDDDDDDEDEDSSSSSEEESSEEEDEKKTKRKGDAELEEGEIGDQEIEAFSLSSDDENGGLKGPIKSKNEIEDLPPVPSVNASLAPYHQIFPVGVVSSIVGCRVIVEGVEKHDPLNEGSILWLTLTRTPLGIIDEIFGPVKNPYYVVRFNSAAEILADVGAAVCFAAEFAGHVLNLSSLCKKGYDASGENDEEVEEETEFSDDEKEAEYRRSLRQAKRGSGNGVAAAHRGNKEMPFVRRMQATRTNQNQALSLPPPLPQSPQVHGQGVKPVLQGQGPIGAPTPMSAAAPMFGLGPPVVQVQGPMAAPTSPQVQGPMAASLPPVQPFGMAPAAAAFAMMQSIAAYGGQNMFPNMFWPTGIAAFQGMLQNQQIQNQVFPGMLPNQQQFQNQASTTPRFSFPPGNQLPPPSSATPWQALAPPGEQATAPQHGVEEVRGRMSNGGGQRSFGRGGRRPFSRGGGRFRSSGRN